MSRSRSFKERMGKAEVLVEKAMKLAPWPDKNHYTRPANDEHDSHFFALDYERARADAAMERLKLSVENIHHDYECPQHQLQAKYAGGRRLKAEPCDCHYEKVLAAIDLPEGQASET